MIATCKHCGVEYLTYPSWLRCANSGYCSHVCHSAATTPRRLFTCEQCGKTLLMRGNLHARRRFCSMACRNMAKRVPMEHSKRLLHCQQCGQPFLRLGSGYQGGGKYCSRACYGMAQRGKSRVRQEP